MNTLLEWIRAASREEREALEQGTGTSINYLYQIAGGSRMRCNVVLAVSIEETTVQLQRAGLTPVRVTDLAAMYRARDFEVL